MSRVIVGVAVIVAFGCGGKKEKGKEYTTPMLIETLNDPDPHMRYWAARELGKVKEADVAPAVPALTAALADSVATVRSGAGYALGDLGPQAKSALPALQKARKDSSKEVRDAADYAVKSIQGGK